MCRFGGKRYDRRELYVAFAKEQAQYDAMKVADSSAILKVPIFSVLFGSALHFTVDLIALSLFDLKSLSSMHQTTGTGSDSDRLLAQMSDRLLVAWMVRPIFLLEMITYGSILVWGILLVTRSLLNIFIGKDQETFAILKGVENDALTFYTCAFVSGYMFGTSYWWMVPGCFLRLSLSDEESVVLTDNTSKAFLLSFVQVYVVYEYLFLFPPHQL
jgi:hypothetical protein